MKICIVANRDKGWILSKIAERLRDELNQLPSVSCAINETPQSDADINHYFIYEIYDHKQCGKIDTLFVTHIDDTRKLLLLRKHLESAYGICMSNNHLHELVAAGIPENRLCAVRIGIDHLVHKRKACIGIVSRCYNDGRKRQWMLLRLLGNISNSMFRFKIIGDRWDDVVTEMRRNGFSVDYDPDFSLEKYLSFFEDVDYALHMGIDEGAIGMIDAIDAGVPIIATRQGYHLDVEEGAEGGLFSSYDELERIFKEIEDRKRKLSGLVENWTWSHYAKRHLEIWNRLLNNQPITDIRDEMVFDTPNRRRFFQRLAKNTILRNLRHPLVLGYRLWAMLIYLLKVIKYS